MTTFTVTATQSGSSANNGVFLLVRVLTSAIEAGGATSGGSTATSAASQGSLTPNGSGSYVAFAVSGDNLFSTMPAEVTNNTYDSNNSNNAHGWACAQGHYSGTVTAATPLTYGATDGSGIGQDHGNWCAYEIQASGTIAVDGSSPALASTIPGVAATTASFTPPAGAVLVAEVIAGGTGSGTGITMTVTDTSGLGLVWTQRAVSSSSDNYQPTWVYTTSLASGTTATVASGTGAALGASVVTSTITVGPKYAGTATDLGGVYGSWGTPSLATGGP